MKTGSFNQIDMIWSYRDASFITIFIKTILNIDGICLIYYE